MSKIATFPVSLSSAATSPCSVHYTTVDGTAVAGTDYTLTVGTLSFAPGIASGSVVVPILGDTTALVNKSFTCALSSPVACTLASAPSNTCVISTAGASVYLTRFNWIYDKLTNTAKSQYFGPQSGAKANTMPYHAIETVLAEAPDWGHESASETVSFWTKLEAWQIAMNGIATGYAASWASIENNYIPSHTNQPWAAYAGLPVSPAVATPAATYQPDADYPSGCPTLPSTSVTTGFDPLAVQLQAAYSTMDMYLMHWLYDVDGVYGFKNGDTTTVAVAVNNYSRGMHEGLFQTIMHPAWDNWLNGGGTGANAYGYLPLFAQSTPIYPSAPFSYAKQVSYTCAPDAEARAVGSAWLANQFAASHSLSVATQDTKAKKLGDYLRYSLYDKYFKAIPGYDGTGAHNLVSWYASWGCDIGTSPGTWGFRIGCSETHFGYNNVDSAYAMATGGGGYTPASSGAGAQWAASVQRQLELIRWLQSPEGPIAGGVTNSWKGRYETPADGRQSFKFYGLYYTYSPVWHSPPSNGWSGYQGWGLERVAALYLATATKVDTFSANIRANCKVILDRFVPWLIANSTLTPTVDPTSYTIPTTLGWTSSTQVVGQTASVANIDGVFEYLPSLNWDSTGNYTTFWSGSSVPNPNLHCAITASSTSNGVAAALAQMLIEYAAAHVAAGGALVDTIPLSSHTVADALALGKGLLDAIWNGSKDAVGFSVAENRADYIGFNSTSYIPASFTGVMPHGQAINSSSTFISTRTWMQSDPLYTSSGLSAYLTSGGTTTAPSFTYHRFWEQCEIASGFAMLHQYFSGLGY